MNTSTATEDLLRAADAPRLAVNFVSILRALTVKGAGLMDVIRVIESHAIIVARLISLANSAWSNPVKPITDVQQACTRLGLDVVRTVSIAVCVSRSFSVGRCPAFDPTLHWLSALIAADVCGELARLQDGDAGTARATGLLHNVGILWLADRFPERTNDALLAWIPASTGSLDGVLRDHVGIGYLRAGCILLERLGLPAAIRNALDDTHGDTPVAGGFGPVQTAAGIAACALHPQRDIGALITLSAQPAERIVQLHQQCLDRLDRYRQQASLLTAG